MPTKPPLILASQSWQRRKILEQLGLKFQIIPAHIDEHHSGYQRPHAIVKSIAKRKAEAIAKKNPKATIIAADTIVILSNGKISLKPKTKKEARTIIKSYQKSSCQVYSGIAVKQPHEKKIRNTYEKSIIYFKNFSDEAINDYLKIGSWKGSSGALTIEEVEDWVSHIMGDYSNILGLPIHSLKKLIKV